MLAKDVVVLFSGGLDSTTLLYHTLAEHAAEDVLAVSVNYGQKHSKELECAKQITSDLGVELVVTDMGELFKYSASSLLDGNDDVPLGTGYAEQLTAAGDTGGLLDTYVPFRNGLMLSYVTSLALSVGAQTVVYGAHRDDAAGDAYPDCSVGFISAMKQAIYLGSGKQVTLAAPFAGLTKAGIVGIGVELSVPFEKTWSCYLGGSGPCGECSTCKDRVDAFSSYGLIDPLETAYAATVNKNLKDLTQKIAASNGAANALSKNITKAEGSSPQNIFLGGAK